MAGIIGLLTGCATTTGRPQPVRTFFLPPRPALAPAVAEELAAPPSLGLYANESPRLPASLPSLIRPSDAEFLMKQADDRFAAGKRAFLEGRVADARHEFNRSIQVLLAAPQGLIDRVRVERHLEELADQIYRYDLDQMGTAEPDEQVAYDRRPLDDILEMTFPVDPSLRGKVTDQIRRTVSQLPLEERDAVISFINFFTTERGKKIIQSGLRHSGRYRDMISRILAEEGLPQELIFVAQAESGFFPRAVSYAACVGMWQFAKFRGNEYGLMQTPATDDRMDPERATRAAARHLKDLFNHFGDWYLAMAAYNCGPNCVDNAVARTGYADFWMLSRLNVLPLQTANYVPIILAMTIIAKNASDYGVAVEFDSPLEYDTIELASPTHVALAAAALDLPVSELRDLNPALLKLVAPAGYTLHVPKGTVHQVEAAFSVIPPSQRSSWRIHRVEAGDTLAALAKRYGTTSAALSSANGGELPEAGLLAAIPVAYVGDRTPAKAAKPALRSTAAPKAVAAVGAKKPASKPPSKQGPAVARKTGTKAAPRRPAGA